MLHRLIHAGDTPVLVRVAQVSSDRVLFGAWSDERGAADWGIVLCWSGTGVSIAANKVPGVRAALCTDAETARLARRYNHANVLALSMRLVSGPVAAEIVTAFAQAPYGTADFDVRNVAHVAELETPTSEPAG